MHHRTCCSQLPALLLIVSALLASPACATNPAAPPTPVATAFDGSRLTPTSLPAPIPTSQPTPAPTSQLVPGSTSLPAAGVSPTAAPTSAVAPGSRVLPGSPTPISTAGPLSIGLDNNGNTIQLQKGQRFLLSLGTGYDWTVTVEDTSIISRVVNITVPVGAQGVYEAKQSGRTTVSAVGDPPCRKSQPPCALPSRTFSVTVVVQ